MSQAPILGIKERAAKVVERGARDPCVSGSLLRGALSSAALRTAVKFAMPTTMVLAKEIAAVCLKLHPRKSCKMQKDKTSGSGDGQKN